MNQIKEKIKELPPSWQNNARDIFRSDLERVSGNKSKEYFFAQKWGLDYQYDPYFDEQFSGVKVEQNSEVEYSEAEDPALYL